MNISTTLIPHPKVISRKGRIYDFTKSILPRTCPIIINHNTTTTPPGWTLKDIVGRATITQYPNATIFADCDFFDIPDGRLMYNIAAKGFLEFNLVGYGDKNNNVITNFKLLAILLQPKQEEPLWTRLNENEINTPEKCHECSGIGRVGPGEQCPTCKGEGQTHDGIDSRKCKSCNGTGYHESRNGPPCQCQFCKGTGKTELLPKKCQGGSKKCHKCKGTGQVEIHDGTPCQCGKCEGRGILYER